MYQHHRPFLAGILTAVTLTILLSFPSARAQTYCVFPVYAYVNSPNISQVSQNTVIAKLNTAYAQQTPLPANYDWDNDFNSQPLGPTEILYSWQTHDYQYQTANTSYQQELLLAVTSAAASGIAAAYTNYIVTNSSQNYSAPECPTPSPSQTPTPSRTPSTTPTISVTPSLTPTPSPTISHTPSVTPTHSVTPSVTPTHSVTPSVTPSRSASPSHTPSVSPSSSGTPTPSRTPSVTPSVTPTISVTPSVTPTISVTPSVTPTISMTPSVTPTISVTPSVTPTISVTPSVTPTISMTPSTTPSASPSSTTTPSPSSTVTPSISPEARDMCLQTFSGTFTSTKDFTVLPNITEFYDGLVSRFNQTVGGTWFRIFITQFSAGQQVGHSDAVINFFYIIYYYSANNSVVNSGSIYYNTVTTLFSITKIQVSSGVLQFSYSNNVCIPSSGGLSTGEKVGITLGVILGVVVAGSAITGLIAALYILVRFINRAPTPTTLPTGDETFADHMTGDNSLFRGNSFERENELYGL